MSNAKEHRISQHAESIIRQFIEEKKASGADMDSYLAYLYANKRIKHPKELKVPTYENIGSLLVAIGLSWREFFEMINKFPEHPVCWQDDTKKTMCDMIDEMSSEQKEKIRQIFWDALSNQVQDTLKKYQDDPVFGTRIIRVLKETANDEGRCLQLFEDMGIGYRWTGYVRDALSFASCPHEYLPEIAYNTGLSLHWLNNAGEPMFGRYEDTEKAMDLFCFLPLRTQQTFCESLRNAVKTGGICLGK